MRTTTKSPHAASLAIRLAGQATMGMALGLGFCLLAVLIDPSNVTSLIVHNAEPKTTAIVLAGFFVLIFGVGAALTGIVLVGIEKQRNIWIFSAIRRQPWPCYRNATHSHKLQCSMYVRKS
jgi:hypothetical protein